MPSKKRVKPDTPGHSSKRETVIKRTVFGNRFDIKLRAKDKWVALKKLA